MRAAVLVLALLCGGCVTTDSTGYVHAGNGNAEAFCKRHGGVAWFLSDAGETGEVRFECVTPSSPAISIVQTSAPVAD